MAKSASLTNRIAEAANLCQIVLYLAWVIDQFADVIPESWLPLGRYVLPAVSVVGIGAGLFDAWTVRPSDRVDKSIPWGMWVKLRWRRIGLLVSLVVLLLGPIAFSFFAPQPQQAVVLVADFVQSADPEGSDFSTSQMIVQDLERLLADQDDVRVVSETNGLKVTESEEARSLGEKYGATIVVWGWYSKRGEQVLISPKFEVLGDTSVRPPYQIDQRIIPRATYESFAFDTTLSNEYSFLTVFTLASIRRSQNDYVGAIALCNQLLPLVSRPADQALILNLRGLSHSDLGESDKAVFDFRRAIEFAPEDKVYYYNLGSEMWSSGNVDEAKFYLKCSVARDPLFASPRNTLGVIEHVEGSYDLAEQYYLKAIELDPLEPIFRENLVGLYVDSERYDLALREADRSLTISPDVAEFHVLKSYILYRTNNLVGAVQEGLLYFAVTRKVETTLLAVFLGAIVLFTVFGWFSRGRSTDWLFSRLLLATSSVALFVVGYSRYRSGGKTHRMVYKALERAVSLRVFALMVMNRTSDIERFVANAFARGVETAEIFRRVGIRECEREQYDEAFISFTRASELEPRDPLTLFYLGLLYRRRGDLQESVAAYQGAAIDRGWAGVAWLSAGDVRCIMGDIRGALVSWSRAAIADPGFVVRSALNNLGVPQAIGRPWDHLKLGLAYSQLHDKPKARIGFELALKHSEDEDITRFAANQLATLGEV